MVLESAADDIALEAKELEKDERFDQFSYYIHLPSIPIHPIYLRGRGESKSFDSSWR